MKAHLSRIIFWSLPIFALILAYAFFVSSGTSPTQAIVTLIPVAAIIMLYGISIVRANRSIRERERRKTEAKLHHPRASHYSWLSDAWWTEWNWDEDDREKANGKPLTWKCMPVEVTEDDRSRAPVVEVTIGAAIPPPGSIAEHEQRLASTIGWGRLEAMRWPVCCGRLGTLLDWTEVHAIAMVSDLRRCLTDANAEDTNRAEAFENWRTNADAIHLGEKPCGIEFLQCRTCGCVYGTFNHVDC